MGIKPFLGIKNSLTSEKKKLKNYNALVEVQESLPLSPLLSYSPHNQLLENSLC